MKFNFPHPEPFRIICLYLIRKFDGQQEQSRMLFFGNDLSKVSWGTRPLPSGNLKPLQCPEFSIPQVSTAGVIFFGCSSKANLLP